MHIVKFTVIVICLLSCFGCLGGGGYKLYQSNSAGQYRSTINTVEKQHKNFSSMPDDVLWLACEAYLETNDYGKFFSCMTEVETGISEGRRYQDEFSITQANFMIASVVAMETKLYLAKAYMALGDYNKAVQLAESAKMTTTTRYGPKYTSLYGTRGLAHALSGNADKARYYAKLLDENAHFVLKKEANTSIAKIYLAIKDYKKALEVLERSDKTFASVFLSIGAPVVMAANLMVTGEATNLMTTVRGEHAFQMIPKAYMLSKVQLENGNILNATMGFDTLLKTPFIENFGTIYWSTLYERGRIHLMENQRADGIEKFKKAVDVIEAQRSSINTEASKIGFVGDKQAVYETLITVLFEGNRFAEAFEYIERNKSRALIDMLAYKKTFSSSNVDNAKLASLIKELNEAEMESIALAYKSSDLKEHADVRSIGTEKKNQITQVSPELASLVSVNFPGVLELQKLLPSDETLIEYYYHGDTLFAFLVTQGAVKGVKLDSRGLNKAVIAFRKNMLDTLDQTRSITIKDVNPDRVADKSTSFRELRDSGRSLYEKIFKPLEPMITTKNVTIVPHGALHYVPFNALITDKGYLLDTYAIRVLPSASVLQFLKTKRGGQTGELIAFGNPDLNNPKLDLPFAQAEALAITKGNPKAKVLLRKQASKTAVKKFSDQFRYVHFACHGIFNPDKPLESGLMLSKDDQNDGMLTVNELYNMRLNADLVTLSACETALGKVSNGDDVVGFTRGFLYAGTNSIVSSLWKVSDEATSLLMQELYKNLKDKDKRTALRLAQLKVKETYNSHPYFWAAFQLTGAIQ